jgi:hypothetical protein
MGYILTLVIGGVVVIGIIAMLVAGKKRSAGQTHRGDDVSVKKPAADEPTPGASNTAGSAQIRSAQKHTPPA